MDLQRIGKESLEVVEEVRLSVGSPMREAPLQTLG